MSIPGQAELLTTFSVAGFGGDSVELADLNGDGRLELLVLQNAGQFAARCYGQRNDLDEVDRTLYCLTACTLDGEVLWQDGVSYDRDFPFTSHGVQGGGILLQATDLDGDGKVEVVVIRRGELVVLDAATGAHKAAVPLPADNFTNGYIVQLGSPGPGPHILCKVNDRAYPPWEYANPVIVYNHDLTVYREPFPVTGAGHNLIARDINGDGRDELFIGYSLLDADCNVLWTLDLGPDYNYARDHADHIGVSDLNGDGELEIRYAGSKDFFVTDLSGTLLWKATAGHSQRSAEGRWGPKGENRLIMSEKNRGMWGLDAEGNVLWNRPELIGYAVEDVRWSRSERSWAMYRPQLEPFSTTPYESGPAWSRDLWPCFLDGDGNRLDVFPWKDGYAQPRRLIRATRSYDCGVKYYPLVRDIDGDGLDEILIYDRDRVWLFRSPEI